MNEAPFRSWVLANFEILATILIFAVVIILAVLHAPSASDEEAVSNYWARSGAVLFITALLCSALSETSAIGFLTDLLRLLFCVVVVVCFLYVFKVSADMHQYYKPVLTAAIVAAFAGGLLAMVGMWYAYRNFEEVASRRMRYRNSDVDLFDIQWKYAFNRFVVIFCYFIIFLPLGALCSSVGWTALLAY